MVLGKKLVKVGSGDCDWFDFTQRATDRELRSAVPEWAHSTVPKGDSGFKGPTCRAANGSIRRSGDPGRAVLITVLVRQQWQATGTTVRRAPQVGRYIRPKDNGLIARLAVGDSN